MNSFLQHLIERSTAGPEPIRPRLASPFEPLFQVKTGEPLLPAAELEEEPRPRAAAQAPAARALEAPRVPAPQPPIREAERPAPARVVPQVEPNLHRRTTEQASEGERIARPPAARTTQQEDRAERPRPTSRVEPKPAPLPAPETAARHGREPEQRPGSVAAAPVAPPQQQSQVQPQQRAHAGHEPERPRTAAVEPNVRSRREEFEATRLAGEIVPTTAPPAAPLPPPARPPVAEPPPAPRVQVSIGRVEVRAVFTPPAAAPSRPRPGPAMSLDDYLKQRDGGS